MNTLIKVALLTSLTTAALVYVILEWQPLRTEGSRAPEITWAEPGKASPEPAAPPAPAADFSDDEQVEESTLKKKKLQVKDRMEALVRQARGGSAHP